VLHTQAAGNDSEPSAESHDLFVVILLRPPELFVSGGTFIDGTLYQDSRELRKHSS
jgi:hypothetical protein